MKQIVGPNGRVVAAGVVCKCLEPGREFCPMHGSPVLTEEQLVELDNEIKALQKEE